MPEQNRKPLLPIILLLAALAAMAIIVIRHLPGKFQPYSYSSDQQTAQEEEKKASLTARISLKDLKPTCFSAGILQNKPVLAVAVADRVEIMDISGNVLIVNKLGYSATAVEFISQPAPLLVVSDGQMISVLEPVTGNLVEKYSPASETCRITSLALDDKYIYAADGSGRVIWQYSRVRLDAGSEPLPACPLGQGLFILPSAKFELAPAVDKSGIWAANTGPHKLELFSPDKNEPVKSWGNAGYVLDSFSGCCNPGSFDLFPDGRFVTCEKGALLVKIFDSEGKYQAMIANRDDFFRPEALIQLVYPLVQAGLDNKSVYVLDPAAEEILILTLEPKNEQ